MWSTAWLSPSRSTLQCDFLKDSCFACSDNTSIPDLLTIKFPGHLQDLFQALLSDVLPEQVSFWVSAGKLLHPDAGTSRFSLVFQFQEQNFFFLSFLLVKYISSFSFFLFLYDLVTFFRSGGFFTAFFFKIRSPYFKWEIIEHFNSF